MELRRWLVRMEWRPAELSVCLPLLSFLALSCTIKSRRRLSFLLAPAHPGSPGMWTVKRLCMSTTVSISASAHGLRCFLFLLELKDCTTQTANYVCRVGMLEAPVTMCVSSEQHAGWLRSSAAERRSLAG